MYFYNARWYDGALGRFTSADSIIPGGIQALDRYGYVNNDPIRYTDPSGHRCLPEDECDTPHGDKNNNEPPGPILTTNGSKMQLLYSYYASHPNGEWNSNGGAFTVADFVAWILMIECAGNTNCLKYSMQAWSRQLWGTRIDAQGNATPTPYCPSSPCTNGVFNFLGAYSQSAMGRYNDLIAKNYKAVEQNPTNYENYGDAGYTVGSVGNDVVTNPLWTDYNNDVATQMGNFGGKYGPSWVTNMCPNTPMFTEAYDGIVYKFKGANGVFVAVYTLHQESYWSSHRSGMCAK